MKVTTKVIGAKAYRALVAAKDIKALELTYCNLDSADWDSWKALGLNVMQITRLEDKMQDLEDDTWLVVTVSE